MTKKSKERVRGIVKAYLIFNKGKWCTSSQISDFINKHYFGLGKYEISSQKIGGMLRERRNGTLFSDINAKKESDNTWRYCYDND